MSAATEKRKVCLLGATGVGKTTLVTRAVRGIFSATYQTTIGVKIEKKRIVSDGRELDLVIWDLNGEDEFQSVQIPYIRGAAGLLVVADGTRKATVHTALRLLSVAGRIAGDASTVCVLNKADLLATWEIDERTEAALQGADRPLVKTSAKTGAGVEEAFGILARAMLEHRKHAEGGLR